MPPVSLRPGQTAVPTPGGMSTSEAASGVAVGTSISPSSEPNLQDALNGVHRDGRIRNPVPSKLKGKTDGSKGNFGVMQIEVSGRTEATDRDAEAKRTSESTELAAKRAFENGYVSLRRSRFVHLPDELVAKPFIPTSTPALPPVPAQRHAPLGPEETKSEQARLLTLLRSLHPVLVVDQICKALAFFGGIPGAPPPAAGGFPESAEANGPGSLFVGWVSEIFPRLGGNSASQPLDHTRQLDHPQPLKRKRGRPKGSKATKARKDKGVKKGPNKPSASADRGHSSGIADESWVDVDESGAEDADDVDANVMLLAQAASPQPQLGTSHPNAGPITPNQAPGAARTALPEAPTANGVATVSTPGTKKRGRPKGSRNRPKHPVVTSAQTPGTTSQADTQPSQGPEYSSQVFQAPQANQTPQTTPGPAGPQSFTAVNSVLPVTTKKKNGRAKGTGQKQQGQAQNNQILSAPEPQEGTGIESTNPVPPAQMHAPSYQAPQTTQFPQAQTSALPTPPTATPTQSKPSKNPGQKRKRKADGNAEMPRPTVENGGNGPAPLAEMNNQALPTVPNTSGPPFPTTAPQPSPKRQRKGKESRPSARKANEVTGEAPSSESSRAKPGPAPRAVVTQEHEPGLVAAATTIEQPVPSLLPPHQSRFVVQSPAIENFEAQLAQFDQQAETEPRTLTSQSAANSAAVMTNRLSQQHPRKFSHQQQHPRADSVGQGRSPNSQPQPTKPQTINSPPITQQQARTSQSHYSQYRASGSQFQQQRQQQQQQQQQQSHTSAQVDHLQQPQQQQQHQFSGGQQQHPRSTQVASAQQYSASTSQQQYGTDQQPYSDQQYRKSLASQQRYHQQQLAATSSAATTSYATHQPQFSAPASNDFSASDSGYRNSATALNNPSYTQRSNQPTTTTTFRPTNTHSGLPQHSPSFTTPDTSLQQQQQQQQRSASTTQQPTSQSMQSLANVQSFSGNAAAAAAADWNLFDASHLDTTAGQQGAMAALGNAGYGINAGGGAGAGSGGGGGVRAPASNTGAAAAAAAAAAAFASTGLATFDAAGLGGSGGERYYGVGRR
ncbi:hypothetical protein F5144DRAFT_480067 [Chaetomium tenue]|uniref:Uncharacterized protein n=1 Tax=Chaetomium tenue TaxID=1854479 RepID=A0ACB7PL44_9PEZI|nr:hypothetical protein F5144DRAFT_480067 [Chaetomium globosum]